MKITARAHTNIALIKYWGKRDEQLFLPMNNSISITLDQFYTTTSVAFRDDLKADSFILNGIEMGGHEVDKISRFLDLIRQTAGRNEYAIIDSVNNVPTAAGFASSASGFAALAAASTKAIGLDYSGSDLSRIARFGSGSACRSIYGGYVEWNKGVRVDGTDSYAMQILEESKWDLSILSVMVEARQKKVLSREGMTHTVKTSDFYSGWLETIDADLNLAREAIHGRDFEKLGTVLERNALKMHATMLGANPPFFYWTGATLDVMHTVQELRDSGIQAYFTIDAGPNVKVICQPKDEMAVKERMQQIQTVREVFVCHPGPGVSYIGE
ncbi:diphosphomevalonate decarboxylase [Sporosarcina highlanderae]|uniref:diphosphomevalonate decarboxylase n=1 Tax=Sporosarcina highlanderae TaxID=3035916 RepID=A0ABT8JRA7_9BACL|nr:diphosphomevalonate decarboxylase [Sporosarcina highlanderae]MDN4607609.1 diphosphomevalonate decarboxylase [Sporosarcina highlanderae]